MSPAATVTQQRAPLTPARCAVAVALAGLAVSIVACQAAYRDGEARLAATFSHLVIDGPTLVVSGTATFFVHAGRTGMFGLRITPECSSWPIAAGFALVSAGLVAGSRLGPVRIVASGLAAVGTFGLINLARIQIVAWATDRHGLDSGFHWAHVWVGSAVTIAGAIAACVVYLLVLGRGSKRATRTCEEIDR